MESLLIVDDDFNLCTVLKEELVEVGYDVDFVNNGDDAFPYLAKQRVDLILLDLKMPGKDGFEVLKELKEKELLLKLARYPEVIKSAGSKYNPSEVAKYLFELVQLFNDYYHEINILKSEPKLRRARLVLIKAIAQVLSNGFDILGLKIVEEM